MRGKLSRRFTQSFTVSRASLSVTFNTGWWWIRHYVTCLHSIAFLRRWVLYSIFLSTMYLVRYSLIASRFMFSVWSPPPVFLQIHLTAGVFFSYTARSRNVSAHLAPGCGVCLQVFSGLNRWRWVTCLRRSPRPARAVTLAGWLPRRGPGADHCPAGRRAVMWGSGIVLPCHRGSRLSLESKLWNDTNLPEPHSLESPSLITLGGTDTRNFWHNCPSDRNMAFVCVCVHLFSLNTQRVFSHHSAEANSGQVRERYTVSHEAYRETTRNELFLTHCAAFSVCTFGNHHYSRPWCQTRHGECNW